MIVELVGILAGLIVLGSFLLKKQRSIRIVNLVGAIIFVVYGYLITSYATMMLNGGLVIVQIVYLYRGREK